MRRRSRTSSVQWILWPKPSTDSPSSSRRRFRLSTQTWRDSRSASQLWSQREQTRSQLPSRHQLQEALLSAGLTAHSTRRWTTKLYTNLAGGGRGRRCSSRLGGYILEAYWRTTSPEVSPTPISAASVGKSTEYLKRTAQAVQNWTKLYELNYPSPLRTRTGDWRGCRPS